MREVLPHRLGLQVAHVAALEHIRSPPIQPASRGTPEIPGGVLVTVMIYRIAERTKQKILTPHP